jgi:hypothetical protein
MNPAQTEAMRSAFHKVCDVLLLRCDGDDPMTECVVTKIVALSQAGEHDASRLVERILNDLAHDGLPTASQRRGRPALVRGPIQLFALRALENQDPAGLGYALYLSSRTPC